MVNEPDRKPDSDEPVVDSQFEDGVPGRPGAGGTSGFGQRIAEILQIPGIKKNQIAEWAEVDPSTVTRWSQGASPSNPEEIMKRLEPHVERARKAAAAFRKTEVESWGSLSGDLGPGIREYVELTGLLAGSYYVVASWIPSSKKNNEYDVVIQRFFDGVWADMSKRLYNIGDQCQIVSPAGDGPRPTFDQAKPLGELIGIKVRLDEEVGKSVARIHVPLNLESLPYRDDTIGFVQGGFGYRFRATRAIVARKAYSEQSNEFLGAQIPIPCRQLNLIACIPKSSNRGSPSALCSSNRSMLKMLMELDDADPGMVESLLWPRGNWYRMSSAPDAPLRHLPRVGGAVEAMPLALRNALRDYADLDDKEQTIMDVLTSEESLCYQLRLSQPHPSLTCNIVWRLPDE